MTLFRTALAVALTLMASPVASRADQAAPVPPSAQPPAAPAGEPPAVVTASDYLIGPDDVLGVLFWRDATMSGDFVVRPDGRISVPLLNDVQAAGLTPETLRQRLLELAKAFVAEPNVTVVVRAINSRKVFVTGQVARQAAYPLTTPTTILQMIALAGGITDYADGKKIAIIRKENGKETSLPFNYEDVRRGKKLEQNILLKAGDVVIVP